MPIPVTCSRCGANYTLPDDKAGSTGRCRCGTMIAVPAVAAPPAAAPPPAVEDVTAPEDEWALDYDGGPVMAEPARGPEAPAGAVAATPGALAPDEEPLEPMNLGARPNIQRAKYLDKAAIGYGFAAFFVIAAMFFIMGAAGGGEAGGAAAGIGVMVLLIGLVLAILGGSLQLVVSALPGQPGGALTVTRRMVWFPYFQRRFRIAGGGQLVRKEEASNVHIDAIFILIILALLCAGGIPGLLFFAAWSEARNGQTVSLTFVPQGGGAGVKLYSAVMSPGKPYPRQLTELEDMLKRVMPLRKG